MHLDWQLIITKLPPQDTTSLLASQVPKRMSEVRAGMLRMQDLWMC